MRTWKIITMTGAMTAVSAFSLIRHNLWYIATILTLVYVGVSIGLLIHAMYKEKNSRRVILENRDRVFKEWLKTDITKEVKK